jgi:DNA-binding response OmpR family regulator
MSHQPSKANQPVCLAPSKILIIDDDKSMRLILSRLLDTSYTTEVFNNALDALIYLQGGNIPDLIISDLYTPGLSGFELITQLKASGFFMPIPIIIISGEDSLEARIICLDAGADDYIIKPFNPAELEARVRVVLRRLNKLI